MTQDKPAIVFKCEASMWQMLEEESVTGLRFKPFDMRRYDMADERIYRLCFGHLSEPGRTHAQSAPHWIPDEPQVSFLNVDSHELLTVAYLGMEFAPWAPGWCFLIVGKTISREMLA